MKKNKLKIERISLESYFLLLKSAYQQVKLCWDFSQELKEDTALKLAITLNQDIEDDVAGLLVATIITVIYNNRYTGGFVPFFNKAFEDDARKEIIEGIENILAVFYEKKALIKDKGIKELEQKAVLSLLEDIFLHCSY